VEGGGREGGRGGGRKGLSGCVGLLQGSAISAKRVTNRKRGGKAECNKRACQRARSEDRAPVRTCSREEANSQPKTKRIREDK
jgi:hypothetical protein